MNSNPHNTPPFGGGQDLPNPPRIHNPEGLASFWFGSLKQPKSSRPIPPKRGSLAGYIPFPSLHRNVWFESSLERDLLLALQPFDGLIGVMEQPLKLHCPDLGYGKGPYSPDFLVWVRLKTVRHLRPVLIEVKYEEDLKQDWAKIRPKLLAARRFARRQGWRFMLITPRHLRIPCPLPPLLSGERAKPYDLQDPITVLARLFGPSIVGRAE